MYSLYLIVSSWFRSILKWFLHKTTGLCELQRICYGEIHGASRVKGIENSLERSKSPQIKKLINSLNNVCNSHRFIGENKKKCVNDATNAIIFVKKISPRIHFQFVESLQKCIEYIWSYKQMMADIESLQRTAYDADNLDHEKKIYELWDLLMPDQPLECRITKQWQDIGFQGEDPKTDFRGMGLLGLENLLYFSKEYTQYARHVLAHAQHPSYGYAFAIVGINITSMALHLCKDGDAKVYFYNREIPSVAQFHQFYCYLFYEFDRFWIECKPKNIMEFSWIRDKFEFNIRKALQDPAAAFKFNVAIDTV